MFILSTDEKLRGLKKTQASEANPFSFNLNDLIMVKKVINNLISCRIKLTSIFQKRKNEKHDRCFYCMGPTPANHMVLN